MTAHSQRSDELHAAPGLLPRFGRMPSFDGNTGWLNSEPLTPGDLRGSAVIVNFWTYTCINWLRQLPYLRAWHANYARQGLTLIGVHTPEFGFEHDRDHVRRAVRGLRIEYPVVLDSEYAIWGAYGNRYWPALYFIDAEGQGRHYHHGEGAYARSEQVLRQLLPHPESGAADPHRTRAEAIEVSAAERAAEWNSLKSAEIYLGYARTGHFATPGGLRRDTAHLYTAPSALPLNHWALCGSWTVTGEAARLDANLGSVLVGFHSRDVHLVMGPPAPGSAVPFHVQVDGRSPGLSHGADVDHDGHGTLSEHRLYQLIRQPGIVTDHTLEIEFLEPNVEIYAFTFG